MIANYYACAKILAGILASALLMSAMPCSAVDSIGYNPMVDVNTPPIDWKDGKGAAKGVKPEIVRDQFTPVSQPKKYTGCNMIILDKNDDAEGMLRCDIYQTKKLLVSVKDRRTRDFADSRIKSRKEILEAIKHGAISNLEAINIRDRQISRETSILDGMIKASSEELNRSVSVNYSSPDPMPISSMTCGRGQFSLSKDIKCDFN